MVTSRRPVCAPRRAVSPCRPPRLQTVDERPDTRRSAVHDAGPPPVSVDGPSFLQAWAAQHAVTHWSSAAMDLAAAQGCLDVVQWLHAHRGEGWMTNAMHHAAVHGHMHVVQWLHANRYERCTAQTMDLVAQNGHLEMLQWLHHVQKEDCSQLAMDAAAQHGHLAIVQWLHANRREGCSWRAVDEAVRNAHWAVAEWLLRHRTEKCPVATLVYAIHAAPLQVIQAIYAREELGSWPRSAHVDVLAGLVRSRDPERLAVLNHILQCRRQRFGLGDDDVYEEDTEADRVHASESQKEEATKRGLGHWLLRYSSEPNTDLEKVVGFGHFECTRFMHSRLQKDRRLRCSKRFLNVLIAKGDRSLAWWHMNSCGAHSGRDWVYAAIWVGRGDVLKLTTKKWPEIFQLRGKTKPEGILSRPRADESHRTMFDDHDASFTKVFDVVLMDVYATVDGLEEACHNGKYLCLWVTRALPDLPSQDDIMDVAAIHGHLEIMKNIVRDRCRSHCGVSGLYGAIIDGHVLHVVKYIYAR